MSCYGQSIQGIIIASRKPPASRCSVAGDIDTDPSARRVCKTGATRSPNLLLTGDTLVTGEGILIFDIHKHLKECISSFENLHAFYVVMREYSVVIFAKNDFDPWVT